jgi:hypothetical protein
VDTISGFMEPEQFLKLKNAIEADDPDWEEHLYPYSQGAPDSYMHFSIDVPLVGFNASTILEWIDKLENDGKKGDKRVVFWFDN